MDIDDDLAGLADEDDDDALGSGLHQQFSANKSTSHQKSNDQILEKRRALFGGGASGQQTSSAGGLQTFGGAGPAAQHSNAEMNV